MFCNMALFPSLGFLQFPVELAMPEKNLAQVKKGLEILDSLVGALIVLPEMWSTGFAYDRLAELAASTDDMLGELARLASRHGCILAGSLPESTADESDRLYNTLYVVGPEGVYGAYRKQQVFTFGGEGKTFRAGLEPHPVTTPKGRIGCLICYDLRFPNLARTQCQQGADLLICSAQWPLARIGQWRALLRARAIENQTFLVACNSCGVVDGVELGGYSAIIDPEGEVLCEAQSEGTISFSLPPAWQTRDSFRNRFSSFSAAPYSFADAGKICNSAIECLELINTRKQLGQQISYCAVGQTSFTGADLKILQEARRQGDFLLVGVLPEAGKEILNILASLGCIDAVCSLADFTDADLERLGTLLAR